nr:hypothetical protein [Tanacetum cinerariifolium]
MMGELNYFIGLQIKQMEDGILFNQSKYIKEMIKKFGLEDSKPMKTPVSSNPKLMKDEECESVDSTKYQGMIVSLLYLTASRHDIMFSGCLCARFQEAPKTSHLEAIKHIFRYIKGTTHLGLWYPKKTSIETIVYADSDHAVDYVDRKSTSGICMFVGCCLTSWFSKKQTALAISTTNVEYVSAGKACQQALWMKQALIDYDIRLDDVPIMCDKKCEIDLSKNHVQHSRTKHIEIRHHFLRDNDQKGHISIEKVSSVDNIADILTKPIKRESFNYIRLGLDINEQIVRFVLEFYCQLTFTYNPEGQFVVNFVIKNKSFSLTLEEFGQILKIPFKGQASFTEMWSLDHLSVSVPSRGLYKTKPPSLRVIKTLIQVPRQGQETRIKNKKTIVVGENEILSREIQTHMKSWVDIIRENAICLGGHKDHVFACLCHILYCIETSTPHNLAFFILKRMEKSRFKPMDVLAYGMLLKRLFKHVASISPELAFDHYLSHDRAMHLLTPHYEQKHERIGARKDLVSQMLAHPPLL